MIRFLPGAVLGALIGWNLDNFIRRIEGKRGVKRSPNENNAKEQHKGKERF